MHSRRAWILTAAATSAAVAAARPAAAATKLRITLPATEGAQAAYLVAQEKGYYAAEGLDVEFVFAGGGTATPALLSGSVDASASSASALSAILRGAALRIVLVFSDTPDYQVWATPEIRTLADLKGKSVGIATRGDTFEIALRLALQAAGVSPDAVGYSPLGFATAIGAALESGALPAAVIGRADSEKMLDVGQLKKAHIIADFFRTVHLPYNGMVVSEKLFSGSPDVLKKLLRALVKANRYFKAYKAPSIGFIIKYQKTPADQRAQALDYDNTIKTLAPDLAPSDDLIRSDVDLRAALNGVPKDRIPPLDKIYDFRPLRAVTAELNASRWKPVL